MFTKRARRSVFTLYRVSDDYMEGKVALFRSSLWPRTGGRRPPL